MTVSRILQTISISTVLGACASAPEPMLYVLDSAAPNNDKAASDILIGLNEVRLPSYARDQKITSLDGRNRVIKDGDHRWASPPEEAVTNKLAATLEDETGARVLVRPIPSGLSTDYNLTVSLDAMLRGQAGEAIVRGQYVIVGLEDSFHLDRFEFSIAPDSQDYDGFMRGVSVALENLCAQIDDELDHLAARSF